MPNVITENRYRCPECKRHLSPNDFYLRRKKDPSSYCKSCTTKKTVERQRNRKRKAIEYKGGACIHCGYKTYDGALEFHHTSSAHKDSLVSKLLRNNKFETALPELDKCILLCVNCHREAHYDPSRIISLKGLQYRELKSKAVDYKGGKCLVCGYKHYIGALEFHHLNPVKKDFKFSQRYLKWEKARAELDKCVLLCGIHHRELHGGIIQIAPTLIGATVLT